MKEILDFLKENKFGNLATCEGNIPDTRPMEMVFHSEKGLFFYTSNGEDLAKQLKTNQNVCFCATAADYNYVKVKGAIVFSDEKEDKRKILENSVFAKKVFNDSNMETMLVFFLPNGKAMMHLHGENKVITDEF
jgi:uncharacterized pyridoxamine 5'-phosphate oxidase family protein